MSAERVSFSMRHAASWAMILPVMACLCIGPGCSRADSQAHSQDVSPVLQFVSSWGVRGNGPGQLYKPSCIASDALGDAYIADAGSQFIHKFDPQGTPLLSFQELSIEQP